MSVIKLIISFETNKNIRLIIKPEIKLSSIEFLTEDKNIFSDFLPIEYPTIPSVEKA